MPPRSFCVAILLYWAVAATGLAHRDLLPELNVGGPPDLRAVTIAAGDSGPVRWSLQVVDAAAGPDDRRTVGQAVTESKRLADGWVEMTSKVWIDSGRLLKGTPLENRTGERIEFISTYQVDPSGNLRSFHAGVRSLSDPGEVLRIDGRLKDRVMEVVSRGPLPIMNRRLEFEYKERGLVGSQFGPIDRLPNLHVGQRWDERVANPLTGRVETVRAEVTQKAVIHWDKGPVSTLEVVHRSSALSARTWVRRDGAVLRQEVPFPLLRLVLERQPDRSGGAGPADGGAAGAGSR
jgi:hypothetical protein